MRFMNEKSNYQLKSIKNPSIIVGLVITIFVLLTSNSFGQSITFQKAIIAPGIQYFSSVVQTSDNGFIAVGRTKEGFVNDFMYIVRFNLFGDTLWTRKIKRDEATSVTKTIDNNYALSGVNGSFVKFDINGNILTIGSFYDENLRINKILQTSDGSYFMCGQYFPGSFYPYLSKYNAAGNKIWDTVYTSSFYLGSFADMVISDDYLILTGDYFPTGTQPTEIFLMKLNQSGNQLWFTSVPGFFYPNVRCITKINSGSFFVGGNYNDVDAFLAKFTSDGTFLWLKGYDTTFSSTNYSIASTFDGGAITCGFNDSISNHPIRVRKVDSTGVELWKKMYGFIENANSAWNVRQTSDSGFVIVGRTEFQQDDGYILKIDKIGDLIPIGISIINENQPKDFNLYQNYPNPFNPNTTITFEISKLSKVTLRVYDITGKEVKMLLSSRLIPSKYSVKFEGGNFSSGIYIYQLTVNSVSDNSIFYSNTKKFILLK